MKIPRETLFDGDLSSWNCPATLKVAFQADYLCSDSRASAFDANFACRNHCFENAVRHRDSRYAGIMTFLLRASPVNPQEFNRFAFNAVS